jgi:uncharacterized protein YwqG
MKVKNAEQLMSKLRESAKPAIHLTPTELATNTRLGGLPNLPEGFEWPHRNGSAMSFVAQLDLEELSAFRDVTRLPSAGCLFFFYNEKEGAWGFDPKDFGSWSVLYSPTKMGDAQVDSPSELDEERRYLPKYLQASRVLTFPTSERLNLDLSDGPDSLIDAENETRKAEFKSQAEHQIEGFPNPIQFDGMELECQLASNGLFVGDPSGYDHPRRAALERGAADWRLLLQVDSDDDSGMMWGDSGILYFWIREQDLAKTDFSSVWMILQCF